MGIILALLIIGSIFLGIAALLGVIVFPIALVALIIGFILSIFSSAFKFVFGLPSSVVLAILIVIIVYCQRKK